MLQYSTTSLLGLRYRWQCEVGALPLRGNLDCRTRRRVFRLFKSSVIFERRNIELFWIQ